MIRPPNQAILGATAKVQGKAPQRTFGYFAPRNAWPVLQPERSRGSRELGVKGCRSLSGIDRTACLRHYGAAVEVLGVAEQGGSGLGKAMNDRPVHGGRSRQRWKQAAVEAVDALRKCFEKGLAKNLGDAGRQDPLNLRGTKRVPGFRRLK
jgi:hypothetical protein